MYYTKESLLMWYTKVKKGGNGVKATFVFKNRTIRTDLGLLILLGLFAITSFTALYNVFNLVNVGVGFSSLSKQIFWYVVGFITMAILASFQNKVMLTYIKKAYWILVGMLVYLLISRILISITGNTNIHLPWAPSINGAVSWITIPLIGSFQPSEFIKIVLIVMTSQIIKDHQDIYPDPTFKEDLLLFIKIGKVLLPPLVLILLQPDTGICMIILFTILVLLMCSGLRKTYIWIMVIEIVLILGGFFYLYYQHPDLLSTLISSYRVSRIDAWLDPESNIQGSSNQLYTALLSLGSAGFWGYGTQANVIAIPEAQTDFIFAAIGQCFGFLGTVTVVILCLVMDLYLCKIAYNTKGKTDRLIIIGIIAMLIFQQMQNMAMIMGLLPITGITLPLISYGGSSILSYFIAFSLIMNISPLSKKIYQFSNKKRRQTRLQKKSV